MTQRGITSEVQQNKDAADIAALMSCLRKAELIQDHLQGLENYALVQAVPFRSGAPVVAKLVVLVRRFWNWMSTKWYVLPLLKQQNDYNALVLQILRDFWGLHQSLLDIATLLSHYKDRLIRCEEQVSVLVTNQNEQSIKLMDYDGWLIAQDHELSAAVHDLSETSMKLTLTNRQLTEIGHCLAALRSGYDADCPDR